MLARRQSRPIVKAADTLGDPRAILDRPPVPDWAWSLLVRHAHEDDGPWNRAIMAIICRREAHGGDERFDPAEVPTALGNFDDRLPGLSRDEALALLVTYCRHTPDGVRPGARFDLLPLLYLDSTHARRRRPWRAIEELAQAGILEQPRTGGGFVDTTLTFPFYATAEFVVAAKAMERKIRPPRGWAAVEARLAAVREEYPNLGALVGQLPGFAVGALSALATVGLVQCGS